MAATTVSISAIFVDAVLHAFRAEDAFTLQVCEQRRRRGDVWGDFLLDGGTAALLLFGKGDVEAGLVHGEALFAGDIAKSSGKPRCPQMEGAVAGDDAYALGAVAA